jgi:hypothetical protein
LRGWENNMGFIERERRQEEVHPERRQEEADRPGD